MFHCVKNIIIINCKIHNYFVYYPKEETLTNCDKSLILGCISILERLKHEKGQIIDLIKCHRFLNNDVLVSFSAIIIPHIYHTSHL